MCGRFVQKTPLGEIQVLFETAGAVPNMPPRYNAAPTDNLAVVRFNPQTRTRALDLLRWGLVPLWAKDPSFGPKCINARRETVATNKIFRDAFQRRRCLIPADAFYEWRKPADPADKRRQSRSLMRWRRRVAASSLSPGCGSAGKPPPTARSCAALPSSPASRTRWPRRSTTACR